MTSLAALPKIDDVLRRPELATSVLPRWALLDAARAAVEGRRRAFLAGGAAASVDAHVPSDEILVLARRLLRPSLRPVINATGVILHTNLGRAPLAEHAIARVVAVARGYSNLEYDLDERGRGSRQDHLAGLVARVTGAESALVVNNCAAAVLVSLAGLAAGREVVVSRGELIEIGGGFRVPDVMRASGARLVEVGTTNKTHLSDYAAALGPETALLLKVHRSNFAVVGFTAEVTTDELVKLGRARGLPVMVDLGSGAVLDPMTLGADVPAEPTIAAHIAAGADLVTFSGDKLLGGPQAGAIAGRAAAIARLRDHPLMRAMRPDKLTLAALEATLELYRDGRAVAEVPVVRMLASSAAELRARAEALLALVGEGHGCELIEVTSAVGGGALPTAALRSFAIALHHPRRGPDQLDRDLRAADPPVIGRIAGDRLVLDVRTLRDDELRQVATAITRFL